MRLIPLVAVVGKAPKINSDGIAVESVVQQRSDPLSNIVALCVRARGGIVEGVWCVLFEFTEAFRLFMLLW